MIDMHKWLTMQTYNKHLLKDSFECSFHQSSVCIGSLNDNNHITYLHSVCPSVCLCYTTSNLYMPYYLILHVHPNAMNLFIMVSFWFLSILYRSARNVVNIKKCYVIWVNLLSGSTAYQDITIDHDFRLLSIFTVTE